ncbi:hypothetical protein CHS0354_022566 [Potamilus streckersoni]|uniref:VWFA domain-containing protein n=1 Tax=Potamilus streckersoni TaxID=2493646 RepID=A0AAE0TBM6_9BIVA|nr:hypothetical protein CHS0354_022566 [Potamilus streckersoni]
MDYLKSIIGVRGASKTDSKSASGESKPEPDSTGTTSRSESNTGVISVEKVDRPQVVRHDGKVLDLAFAMDCTGSMGSYIETARQNIRTIVEEIVASEKSDIKLALVEYRDHPPQDSTFVTRVHDFTPSPKTMKSWLDACSAEGGGDTPEAVADALHDLTKLSWRPEATKICVFISDAPPHGLGCGSDGFPNGCPLGLDPMEITRQLAEMGITIYLVGCEPSITPFKEFFMAIAYMTGGQYVPLRKANLLTQVIIGGAREEMSLEQWMAEVDEEVQQEMAAGREIDEAEIHERVFSKLKSKGAKTNVLTRNSKNIESASEHAKKLSELSSMDAVRKEYKPAAPNYETSFHVTAMSLEAPRGVVEDRVADESYDCVESEVTYEQAQRMVQKSMMRNLVKKK